MIQDKITSYRDLIVWQKSIELVREVYKITNDFPQSEVYGLTAQIRRAAVSIPANIAEGSRRGSQKDYRHFLLIAFGSGSELETEIEIAKSLQFIKQSRYQKVDTLLDEVMKMLNTMVHGMG